MSDLQEPKKQRIWNSKLARRIVPIAVCLIAVPIVLTVQIVGSVGREQIVRTVHEMQGINNDALTDAGIEFEHLGQKTLLRANGQAATISTQAVHNFSDRQQTWQSQYLQSTAADFDKLTQDSLADSTRQSLTTHQEILHQVSDQMGSIFTRSTQNTEQHAVRHIQDAMLSQITIVMRGRAEQLAGEVTDNIKSHENYLALTAQMPDFLNGHTQGQKAILDALVRRYPMLSVVSAIDSEGHETAKSASDHIVTPSDLGNCATTPYFKTGMHDQPYLGVEEESPGAAPVLRLAMPIEKYHGRAAGVLTARLSLADVWDLVQATRIGQSGFAYVTDNSGKYLLAPQRGRDLLRQSADVDALHWRIIVAQPRAEVMQPILALQHDITGNGEVALAQMRTNLREASNRAESRMQNEALALRDSAQAKVEARTRDVFDRFRQGTAQQTVAELAKMQGAIAAQAHAAERDNNRGMDVAARSASNVMSARVKPLTQQALRSADRRLSLFGFWIMVTSCVAGIIVSLLLATTIVRPVVRLAQGTRAIAQGQLDKPVDERAPGEIQDLAVAFNTMAASLLASRNELQLAETQLVHSAKLASLGTLSAGVAHELNQPLAIIRGVAQQMQEEQGLNEATRDDLLLIEGQTSRMMKIVKHLRTFARAGGYEQTAIDVNQVIQDCFILIGAQLKAHNIEVEFALGADPSIVLGDSNELEQVFLNLITNARDALEEHAGAKLTIRSWRESDTVIVEFADNGPGVPIEIGEHIFDPFFTTKEPGKGTGLGLSISHGIIEKHHGVIAVRNDGGAVFRITLPYAQEEIDQDHPVALAA